MAQSNRSRTSPRRKSGEVNAKIVQPLIWKGFSPKKSKNLEVEYGGLGKWDDPNLFISGLEKVETWIFSRIVESIWWQVTLLFHAPFHFDNPKIFIQDDYCYRQILLLSNINHYLCVQSLTPHMQLVDAKIIQKDMGSTSRKSFAKMSSSHDQEPGNLSLDIWKNAFREACERICPVRAGGHECGCLPVLPRLVSSSSSFVLFLLW